MILLASENALHSKEKTGPENGSKVLWVCNLITEDIDSRLKLLVVSGWGKNERGALQDDVLMGLLFDHPAEFVLMREDDGNGGGLGMLDESGSTAG